ncbi:probable membrane protein STY1534 [Sulfuriferula multivorans]|uniref:Probable membrane protein STY1534 n=1 Tax=Sulfuriferula multivorans TaxID=1559896 RepID=A0A401JFA1_9PROT|nr:bestrophin family protein [Sulfuriferula multivorans]GBL46305.1 probable membrane protein STY1534 [Sulfuriferula multivorans]
MIVRDRPSGLRLFFILKGSILSRIWKVLLVNTAVAILVAIAHGSLFNYKIIVTAIPFTLIGLPLAIFLGFRNNAAYDRYWEGRKLWGRLVSDTQNLSRQCQNLIQQPAPVSASLGLTDIRVRMIYRAIAYAHSLRDRLRNAREASDLSGLLQEEERRQLGQSANGPNFLMFRMGADLGQCVREGRIEACLAASIDATLSSMVVVNAGCERIKNTPIPFSYTLLLHRTAYLYCFLLPFGLVDSIGFMTPFVVAIVAYTFFGLDALGDEIEEPFGLSENDLPLDALCRTIEVNLRESIGDAVKLPALAPVNYCLM